MRGQRQHMGWWLSVVLAVWFLPTSTAWGYFFDDRRESRATAYAVMLKIPTSVSSRPKVPSIVSSSIRCLGRVTCWLSNDAAGLTRPTRTRGPIDSAICFSRSIDSDAYRAAVA